MIKKHKHKDKDKISLIQKTIEQAEKSIETAKSLLLQITGADKKHNEFDFDKIVPDKSVDADQVDKVIQGEFDGKVMIGKDYSEYAVPPNYASKSKLIQGDKLKLAILKDGSFVYKQIGPAERKRIRGVLKQMADSSYAVDVDGKIYKVLLASVTYFKAEPGDEVILLVPKHRASEAGAIENVIKN